MKKIALTPFQDSAVGFFRILQPGRVLVRERLFNKAMSLPFSGEQQSQFYEFNDRAFLEITKDSDIMWSTVVYKPEYITKFLNLRWHNSLKKTCKMVYDMDDNFYAVPADNPTSKDIEPLKNNFHACLQAADGVTVSVPMLKKLYEKINPNVYVNPNGLDFHLWDKLKTKKNKRKIRIGWRGAYGHRDDLELIIKALEAIYKDYKIEFVTLGWNEFKPNFPVEKHKWVSTFEYPQALADLNLDIGIVPLVDSAYNRCKSNLAYLEYSALGIPTVISPVENQKGMKALEAQTNFEWYSQLEKLITDKEYRFKLGEAAKQFVHKNYNVKKQVVPLAEWFDELPFNEKLNPKK